MKIDKICKQLWEAEQNSKRFLFSLKVRADIKSEAAIVFYGVESRLAPFQSWPEDPDERTSVYLQVLDEAMTEYKQLQKGKQQ